MSKKGTVAKEDIIDIVPQEVEQKRPERALVPSQTPSADSYLPALTIAQATKRYKQMTKFVKGVMVEGLDYGTIPGTPKPTLYKPGAEKLTTLFGLSVKFIEEKTKENWDDERPLFFYQRKCQLWRGDLLIAEASGSANSNEGRYRWRWVREDEVPPKLEKDDLRSRGGFEGVWRFAYEKRETSGKYGKPESYWEHIDACLENNSANRIEKQQPWNNEQGTYIEFPNKEYRVPNEDIFSLVNTILKMAEKRALVAAVLIGCNASDFFTQDLEEITVNVSQAVPEAAQKQVEERETVEQSGAQSERKQQDFPSGCNLEVLRDKYKQEHAAGSAFSSTEFWTLVKCANAKLKAGLEGTRIIATHTSGKNTNWREAVEEVLNILDA